MVSHDKKCENQTHKVKRILEVHYKFHVNGSSMIKQIHKIYIYLRNFFVYCNYSISTNVHFLTLFYLLVQLYFDKITELTVNRSDSVLFKEALSSLATDSGLHPLVPYFSYFIAEEVNYSLIKCLLYQL